MLQPSVCDTHYVHIRLCYVLVIGSVLGLLS